MTSSRLRRRARHPRAFATVAALAAALMAGSVAALLALAHR